MLFISTISVESSEYLLRIDEATAFAVSIDVRQGIFLSTVFLLILTESLVGILPFEDVDEHGIADRPLNHFDDVLLEVVGLA